MINLEGISIDDVKSQVIGYLQNEKIPKKTYLVVPDITRYHSKSGEIACVIYDYLKNKSDVYLIIALGTHEGMTKEEAKKMYPNCPYDRIINHNFRNDVAKIGVVPKEFVKKVSDNLCDFPIDVEINKLILDGDPLVISIGQVVSHEVVGMANGNKNLFVGVGGNSMINSSHFLGAVCDMEKIMGRDHSAVREVFDYAEKNFLEKVNHHYILDVISNGKIVGLFIGKTRKTFEEAVKLSQSENIIYLYKPIKKVIVNLPKEEYKSTWLGNKSVYRTRLAIEDGGELIVLGEGIERFGEDKEIDRLIREYGYVGRDKVLKLASEKEDLKQNLSAAAHLIHGSSNGRFKITYAVKKLTKNEVEGVNFCYAPYDEIMEKYKVNELKEGENIVCNEEIFYIKNPAVGLWAVKGKIK